MKLSLSYFILGSILLFTPVVITSFVDTKEVAVVYRFGSFERVLESGIHFHYPYPIETVERLSIRQTHVIELGEQLVLTGDANLVNMNTVAQYEVVHIEDFVLRHKDVDLIVQKILQTTTIRMLGQSIVDQESFLDRIILEKNVRKACQEELTRQKLGVKLTSLGIRELSAPKAVIDAFNEISSARGEKATMILSAESYSSKIIPNARGDAQRIVEEAKSDAFGIVSTAKERKFRYEQILPIYTKNPDFIRKTLRAQTWKNISKSITVHQLGNHEELFLSNPTEQKR